MNLPTFNPIQTPQPLRSSYYTFSKALKDFDRSTLNNSPYFYSKMVALNLPFWNFSSPNPKMFFRFRKSTSSPQGDISNYSEQLPTGFPEIESFNECSNPNTVIPLLFQYYMENIIRQTNIIPGGTPCEQVVELAFWKTLNLLGLSQDQIFGNTSTDTKSIVTFVNNIATSNFINVSNNQGWCEIVASIPNQCPLLNITQQSWTTLTNVDNIVNADENDDNAIYDPDQGTFAFNLSNFKKVTV